MAKSRVEKNKKLYETLDEEMKNNKGNIYEEKLKAIDPYLDNDVEEKKYPVETIKNSKKNEVKSFSSLAVIAKTVNEKKTKKNDLVPVKKKNESKKMLEDKEEDYFEDPISFTDKLSVEQILRAKLEKQENLKNSKKNVKKSPNDETYTPEMMQERIKLHEGVNVRKEANVVTKDYKWLALGLLTVALIAVIGIGLMLIFKVIKI